MDAIQSSTLRDMRLPTPLMGEQERILAIYIEAKSRLSHLRDEAGKLALLKSALMQDLLTGRVSVAPLLESHPA